MTGRILIVENDEAHRATLERHLANCGYDTQSAGSAEDALNKVFDFAPQVVVCDSRLPGMSGIELLRKLEDSGVDADVIVVTAMDNMQEAIDAMKAGAVDYLRKPLDLDAFTDVVERSLEAREKRQEADTEPQPMPAMDSSNVLIGRDPKMLAVYKLIGKVAPTRAPVLIRGETGTGKELVSRVIHANSGRPHEPFLPVNCAAIPETLLESELFGHVKGAFTGAVADRKGRFELAGSGIIFLDEVGDTSPAIQAKLLRVLQEQQVYPLGGEAPRHTDARVVAATNRPIEELIETGEFREDLFYRLRVIEIEIPPLRERREDIPLLARHILAQANRTLGKSVQTIPDSVMGVLLAHDWPGNVRELQNAITRAVVLSTGSTLHKEDLVLGREEPPIASIPDNVELEEMERMHVQRVLTERGGNKSATARTLGISRPRLNRMIERHGLVVPT